jgi:RHS repeat-associated protein
VVEDLKLISHPLLFGRHIAELRASDNALVRTYVWGLDLSGTEQGAGGLGGLLMFTHHGSPVATHFSAYDGNGNGVVLVSASDGSPTARYEYGPFGEPIRVTGPAAALNPFRFSTKRVDPTTDLLLYEYRPYRPTLGRWLSRDPLDEQGGYNLYAFVLNESVNEFDIHGLWTMDGVLEYLCCCGHRWVVDDCLARKTVFGFDEIKVTYDKYEKRKNGKNGKYLGKHQYYLAGKNDGNIWVENRLSDGGAAATLLHECLHDRISGPSDIEEEVQVRIIEEWFRIHMAAPEGGPGFRTTISLCSLSLTIPNPVAISQWVQQAYGHRDPDSPFIFENRKEDVKDRKMVSGWKCPGTAN